MDYAEKAMELHRKLRGKLEMHTRTETGTREALSIAYTPGVAAPCLAIKEDPAQSYELTRRWNTVAVVTDGTAVLGLGDIGPEAGMPVMEGKCILFKDFGDVDAIPLCIRSKNVDEIVHTVSLLAAASAESILRTSAHPAASRSSRSCRKLVTSRCSTTISTAQRSWSAQP